jgi:hypothetical protein
MYHYLNNVADKSPRRTISSPPLKSKLTFHEEKAKRTAQRGPPGKASKTVKTVKTVTGSAPKWIVGPPGN